MGQPMPDIPIEYGDDCLICFPSGKTPKYVYARFSLIYRCTGIGKEACLIPPNDRVFKLTQQVGFPCSWRYLGGTWECWYQPWRVADGKAGLFLNDLNLKVYFDDTRNACPPEGTVWHNDIDCDPPLTCAIEGVGCVVWTPQATQLLEDINLAKSADLFMELRPLVDGNLVYKFCRLQDATNIKILFEP